MIKESVSVTVRLPLEEKEEIRKYSEENDVSLSWVVRKAVKDFLKNNG